VGSPKRGTIAHPEVFRLLPPGVRASIVDVAAERKADLAGTVWSMDTERRPRNEEEHR
jgi:hypothetical protein